MKKRKDQDYLPNEFSRFTKSLQEPLKQGLVKLGLLGVGVLILGALRQSPSWHGVLDFVLSRKSILLLIS
ncbi:MAG: hypothetical protein WBN94_13685, partial [Methanothrix sp.]